MQNQYYLTDGGLETTLLFHHGIDLPEFAAFPLIETAPGRQQLIDYFCQYLSLAEPFKTSLILESPTWRASQSWGDKLGFDAKSLSLINHQCIELLHDLTQSYQDNIDSIIISGCVGPRSDAYASDIDLDVHQAEQYHLQQIQALVDAKVDWVSGFTLPNSDEALGMVRCAQQLNIPIVISFTVETNGRLPSGELLQQAIERIDLLTGDYPLHYMINCAHPTHFDFLFQGDDWEQRIKGIRANASQKSHAELDEAMECDSGDAEDLAECYKRLKQQLPHLAIFGGCCGTDITHLKAIATTITE